MSAPQKIAVAGATGRVGRHVVDVLTERGLDVVAISRANGVDVITTEGLAAALDGVNAIIDVATGPSPEEDAATAFFTTASKHLHEYGAAAGAQRMIVVSIVGVDQLPGGGYNAAVIAHEKASLAGPIPARILRATQFHEFIEQLVAWGTQGEVSYVPNMRMQPVAARSVAEALVDLATADELAPEDAPIPEIAGPREEQLVNVATLLVARRGDALKIEGVTDPSDPTSVAYERGALLPGPHAKLAGPTFEQWLDATYR